MAVDKRGRLIGVPTAGRINVKEGEKVGIVRPINFARDLIAKAREGKPYVSPYITPLTDEAISKLRFVASVSSSGFTLGCESTTTLPKPGDTTMTVAFDYAGFPAGQSQDVVFAVVAKDKLVGGFESGSRFPFAWKEAGCATVTIPLTAQLAPATDYRVVALIGPNYERTGAVSDPFSVGAGAAPNAPAPGG